LETEGAGNDWGFDYRCPTAFHFSLYKFRAQQKEKAKRKIILE
jgi:hypothetical protein